MNNLNVCDLEQFFSDKKQRIDMYYLCLLEAMKIAMEYFKFISHKKYVHIPGWNIYCKNKYSIKYIK